MTKIIFTNIHSDLKNELAPAAFASLRQITQLWSHRFSQKTNFGNSRGFVESKIYTKEETSQTGIRLHSSQPALLIHRAVCGNIGEHGHSTLCKASNVSARWSSKEHCLGQTPGQTQSGSGWTAFWICLSLCFSCLRNQERSNCFIRIWIWSLHIFKWETTTFWPDKAISPDIIARNNEYLMQKTHGEK